MRKLIIAIAIWGECDHRINNLNLCKTSFNDFAKYYNSKYSKSNNIHIECSEFLIDDKKSIRNFNTIITPKTLGKYDRSIRINWMIKHLSELGYSFVLNCDTDLVILEKDFEKLSTVINKLSSNSMISFNIIRTDDNFYKEFNLNYRLIQQDSNKTLKYILTDKKYHRKHRNTNASGTFLMSIKSFIRSGGYHEGFHQWGYEDMEFLYRHKMKNGLESHKNCRIDLLHIWHPPQTRNLTDLDLHEMRYSVSYFKIVSDIYKKWKLEYKNSIKVIKNRLIYKSPTFGKYKSTLEFDSVTPISLNELKKHLKLNI